MDTRFYQSILLFLPICAFASDWVLECPEHISNAGRCAAHKERLLIKKYPLLVSRAGDTLKISTKRGNQVELEDKSWHYYAIGYIEQANILLVRIQYWEGNSHLVVDTENGYKKEIYGFPTFNKDFTQFVATDYDLEAGYNPNILGVYKKYASWRLEYFISPDSWGSDSPVWIDDNNLTFTRISAPQLLEYKRQKYMLTKRNGNWWLSPFNKQLPTEAADAAPLN
jgi:hypothetical protein